MTHSNKIDTIATETHNWPVKTAYSYLRVSTPQQQLKGSGLARQAHLATEYCQANNLRLDETLKLSDEGLSGWTGENLVKGKLGQFLKLVDASKVKRGSFLLVESLDRITRQNVMDAQELFLSIINRGIVIVTLMDNQVYSRDEITKNPWKLMVSLSVMIRANEESETKSVRIKKTKDNRRQAAIGGKHFKFFCPPWCVWKDESFKLVPERTKIIKRIFEDYLAGKGTNLIASTLNKENIAAFGHGTTYTYKNKQPKWYKSAIRRFLGDKRLIGYAEFLDKDNYFPMAISADLFNQVQSRRETNLQRIGGQVGTGVVNIFAGLMKCSHCGSSMCKCRNKNGEGYVYDYLVCEAARTGKLCKFKTIRLDVAEKTFLYLMRYRPWFQEMLDDNGRSNEIDTRIEILTGEKLDVERQLEKMKSMLLGHSKLPTTFLSAMTDCESKLERIKAQMAVEEGKRTELESTPISEDFFCSLPQKLKSPDYRLKIREVLRTMIKEIRMDAQAKYPFYQIERTNGNFWSVVFINKNRPSLQFQFIKGKVSEPSENEPVYDNSNIRMMERDAESLEKDAKWRERTGQK